MSFSLLETEIDYLAIIFQNISYEIVLAMEMLEFSLFHSLKGYEIFLLLVTKNQYVEILTRAQFTLVADKMISLVNNRILDNYATIPKPINTTITLEHRKSKDLFFRREI